MNKQKAKHSDHEDQNISQTSTARQLFQRNKKLFSMIYVALFMAIFIGLLSASFMFINNDERKRQFTQKDKSIQDKNDAKKSNPVRENVFESCDSIADFSLSEIESKILLDQVEEDIAKQENEAKKKRDQLLREFESSDTFVFLENLAISQVPSKNLTISRSVQESVKCIVEFYDSHEGDLTFEEIRACELVEFEYAQILRGQMSSLFEIRRHLANLVKRIQLSYQIVPSNIKQSTQEIIMRSSLYILKSLSLLSEKNPEYFRFVDKKLMEINELKNSISMKLTIQQLAKQWEDNWREMKLIQPSHIAIIRNHIQKSETLKVEEEQMKHSSTESYERHYLKEETSQVKRVCLMKDKQDEEVFEDQQIENIKDCTKGISSENCIESKNVERNEDLSNIDSAGSESSKIQNGNLDNDQLGLLRLTSEERDELIPLNTQVKILWKSSFYKKNFKNLQANNYYLAERNPKKQQRQQL